METAAARENVRVRLNFEQARAEAEARELAQRRAASDAAAMVAGGGSAQPATAPEEAPSVAAAAPPSPPRPTQAPQKVARLFVCFRSSSPFFGRAFSSCSLT
jgi:hypothetical protein